MLAYTYKEQGKFMLEEKEKPVLQEEEDAIVRVTLASICSSIFISNMEQFQGRYRELQ